MEDEKIIDLFFERSEIAISSLSEKYSNLCRKISYNITRSELDSEECINDAYLSVWNSIPPNRPDSLMAYVAAVTRNISIQKYRSNTARKRNSFYDKPIDEFCDCISSIEKVDDNLKIEELTGYINSFLEKQKPLDRAIFIERFWFCYEISEIMENHKLSKNYVNVHIHRTKNKLRKYLQTEGYLNEK